MIKSTVYFDFLRFYLMSFCAGVPPGLHYRQLLGLFKLLLAVALSQTFFVFDDLDSC